MKESHKKRKENRFKKLPDIKQCEKGFMQMRKDIFGAQVPSNGARMSTELCSQQHLIRELDWCVQAFAKNYPL